MPELKQMGFAVWIIFKSSSVRFNADPPPRKLLFKDVEEVFSLQNERLNHFPFLVLPL